MSERLEWQPSPEDIETAPSMLFVCKIGEFALRPWNTALFTFRREQNLDQWDHIFHWRTDESPWPSEEGSAIYIPRNYILTPSYQSEYKKMEEYMFNNDYPAHLNGLNVPQSDTNVIRAMIAQDLAMESYPEEWDEEQRQ